MLKSESCAENVQNDEGTATKTYNSQTMLNTPDVSSVGNDNMNRVMANDTKMTAKNDEGFKGNTSKTDDKQLNITAPEIYSINARNPNGAISDTEATDKNYGNCYNEVLQSPATESSISESSAQNTKIADDIQEICDRSDLQPIENISNDNTGKEQEIELSEAAVENLMSKPEINYVEKDVAVKTNTGEPPKPIGSLSLLNQYVSSSDEQEDSSDDDEDSDSEKTESTDTNINNVMEVEPLQAEFSADGLAASMLDNIMSKENYRTALSDDSDTDSDDSDLECIDNLPPQTIDIPDEDELNAFMNRCDENQSQGPIKAKGEFGIEDLPSIEELTITVPEAECIQLGKISGVVETLVLVESLPNFAAVDIDTVLFLDKGNKTLGQVFDVMGNVASPIYCVRFNRARDIVDKQITVGTKVYVAPRTQYTHFIVLRELINQKGCDASWENDHEAPDGCNEFSDDEEERIARRAYNQRQRNRNRTSISSETEVHLPKKVTIKEETVANVSAKSNRRQKYSHGNRNNHKNNDGSSFSGGHTAQRHNLPVTFYKNNRDYANANLMYVNLHPPHAQQQQQQPCHDYSWHTSALHEPIPSLPPAAYAGNSQRPPQVATHPTMHSPLTQGYYPNPFALQSNIGAAAMGYTPFNLQSFPPLPPPMTSFYPAQQHRQFHRNHTNQDCFKNQKNNTNNSGD